MMSIIELFHDEARRTYAAVPEMDALTEADALLEAELVDVRVDVTQGDVGLLFDLRGALQLRAANAAVVIVRGTSLLTLQRKLAPGRRAATIMGSTPETADGFTLTLDVLGEASLVLKGTGAEFYVGMIAGLPDNAPDYIDDDTSTILAGIPAWTSPFDCLHATFFDRASR